MQFRNLSSIAPRRPNPFPSAAIIFFATFLLSCETNSIPLEIGAITKDLPPRPFLLLVHYEERLSGKSFFETAWSNSSPYWGGNYKDDIGIGRQPGQSIKRDVPNVHNNIHDIPPDMYFFSSSSIIFPFGRFFVKLFETGLNRSFPDYHECFSFDCERNYSTQNPLVPILRIKIETFHVWEQPKSHINVNIKGRSHFFRQAGNQVRVIEFDRTLKKVPLTGFNMSKRLRGVNNAIRDLTETVAVDILTRGMD